MSPEGQDLSEDKQGSDIDIDIDKAHRRVLATVIGTNALIGQQQFQILCQLLGERVVLQYQYKKIYGDEEPTTEAVVREEITFKDLHFVTDPTTQKRYLAFLETDENTLFPYFISENAFSDETTVRFEGLSRISGEVLWTFEHPQDPVRINKFGSVDIIQLIKFYSESVLNPLKSNNG